MVGNPSAARSAARRSPRSAMRTRLELARAELRGPTFACPGTRGSLPNTRSSRHFYLQYRASSLVSLTIAKYAATLDTAWETEVRRFGWARPPRDPGRRPPGGRYPVRVENLSAGLYGYVSGTAIVGNNRATPWNDQDAAASCMVLNRDFAQFPGSPLDALRATAAHEFNHSIQFGYGALTPTRQGHRRAGRRARDRDGGRGLRPLERQLQLPMAALHLSDGPIRWLAVPVLGRLPGDGRTVRHGKTAAGPRTCTRRSGNRSVGANLHQPRRTRHERSRPRASPCRRPTTMPRSRSASCRAARTRSAAIAWRRARSTRRPGAATPIMPPSPRLRTRSRDRSPTTTRSTGSACRWTAPTTSRWSTSEGGAGSG